MHFALGKAYDDAGSYADAFQEWLEGNALKRQQIDYDEAATLAELDHVRSTYTAEMIQKSQGTATRPHVPFLLLKCRARLRHWSNKYWPAIRKY